MAENSHMRILNLNLSLDSLSKQQHWITSVAKVSNGMNNTSQRDTGMGHTVYFHTILSNNLMIFIPMSNPSVIILMEQRKMLMDRGVKTIISRGNVDLMILMIS